jgi:Domain of unknown function (DUF4926)
MIPEHDTAVLLRDLPEHGLVAGDYGVVISVHSRDGKVAGYTLEVFALNGETIDIVDVLADAVRPARNDEVGHARPVAAE